MRVTAGAATLRELLHSPFSFKPRSFLFHLRNRLHKLKTPTRKFYNPHDGTCDELKKFASLYKNIPRDMPSRCQLPDEIALPNGRTIHRPPAWS